MKLNKYMNYQEKFEPVWIIHCPNGARKVHLPWRIMLKLDASI